MVFPLRLRKEAGENPKQQIAQAYRVALGRAPTRSELSTLEEFLRSNSLEQVCRVILNLNEFAYAD